MALILAIVPIVNGITFTKVPIATLIEEGETGMTIRELCRNKTFWILMLMMLCAGASEQGVSQWASTFAGTGTGSNQDHRRPCRSYGICDPDGKFQSLLWKIRRQDGSGQIYDRQQHSLHYFLSLHFPCTICICVTIGCSICGFSVGISAWPGSFSKASMALRRGGTSLFALLALAGDVGCLGGPTLVGFVSGILSDNLKKGILGRGYFPCIFAGGNSAFGKEPECRVK